jgi:hypothetical protein
MAYTTGQTTAQIVTAIQSANSAALSDAIQNALSGLALAQVTPINTPVLLWGVLVKCTTGYGNALPAVTPVFAYDATPA